VQELGGDRACACPIDPDRTKFGDFIGMVLSDENTYFPPRVRGAECRHPGPRYPLPLNDLPDENPGTAGRIGEVRLGSARQFGEIPTSSMGFVPEN
jgi:hypothetical protein